MPVVELHDAHTQSLYSSTFRSTHQPIIRELPKNGVASTGQTGQLVSPPASPLLTPVTEHCLRNGANIDNVQQGPINGTLDETQDDEEVGVPRIRATPHPLRGVQDVLETAGSHMETKGSGKEKVLKLSSRQLYDLTSSPDSLPLQTPFNDSKKNIESIEQHSRGARSRARTTGLSLENLQSGIARGRKERLYGVANKPMTDSSTSAEPHTPKSDHFARPATESRIVSTPMLYNGDNHRNSNTRVASKSAREPPPALKVDDISYTNEGSVVEGAGPSPMPSSIPAPPLSMPTYLQLELSSDRPSPLFIHRSATSDFPYESSRVKIDRLKNFMLLPPQLEQILWFGALACMDAWLSAFTILPLRFIKALAILIHSWSRNIADETKEILRFIYTGSGRMWKRHRQSGNVEAVRPVWLAEKPRSQSLTHEEIDREPSRPPAKSPRRMLMKHAKTKSTPSALLPDHKADILRGLLILISCNILMYFDASRIYHSIRGQAAIKLYVIYNVLEVCDRLFSALGQDVLECLFSREALERKADGRSKVLRPFWLFILALAYNLVHSTALFYQVITLNVAVNSYSNALLTLLMSNQFVEIKSTVFKKFEKENLFQLTCADVVERFQLWLMLMIIASRNVVETGGLKLGFFTGRSSEEASLAASASILPRSFTLFPSWTGQVLAPFFLVLGSEMLVDWLKHSYINKFNNTKPAIYGRFLDVLAKDYYSNAFADQNLTRRLGLPVIPLACLFIRASVQTYHMFLATYLPPPLPSTATSLSVDSATTSAATTEALAHIDNIFRRAVYGPSSFGMSPNPYHVLDFLLPYILPLTTLLLLFLFFLSVKILLGMALLSFARSRYQSMKEREGRSVHAEGRRVGGWGIVEVDEDKRRWIYADDPEGVDRLREREARDREKVKHSQGHEFDTVERYSMIAKRIW